jgi:hypothetical protein
MSEASPSLASGETPKRALGSIYVEAITKEGLVPSEDLVALVEGLHRATLTTGLIMRAFHSLRQARSGRANQRVSNAPKP